MLKCLKLTGDYMSGAKMPKSWTHATAVTRLEFVSCFVTSLPKLQSFERLKSLTFSR